MCMSQEISTQINTSKQESNIVSDWLHHCCTLENSTRLLFFPAANQKTAGTPEGEGEVYGFGPLGSDCSNASAPSSPSQPAPLLMSSQSLLRKTQRGQPAACEGGLEELEGEEEKIGVKKKKRLWFPTPYPC